MVQNSIKDLIDKYLNKSWKKEIVTKSMIWNLICEEYKNIKNIDINEFLVSIQIKWNLVIIKTWKPILNAEILNYKEVFEEKINQKLKNVWIKIKKVEIILK